MWKFLSRHTKDICWKSTSTSCTSKVQTEPFRPICCFTREDQCNGKKEEAKEKRGKRPTWDTNDAQIQQHNWIGALGWSGVLIVGWYLCHPTHLRTLLGNNSSTNHLKTPGEILIKSVSAQPDNQILPKALTSAEQTLENSSHFVHDTLDQAAENLSHVHGSVENRLAVELARRKRYKEAAVLFRNAAERGNAFASFNLGLCHEMGLGISQDFRKAAECYETASSAGHPTATYNLGVFHVHGWGGLTADRARARQLFTTAAQLGQADAKRALGMDSSSSQHTAEEVTPMLRKSDSIAHLIQDATYKYTTMLEA